MKGKANMADSTLSPFGMLTAKGSEEAALERAACFTDGFERMTHLLGETLLNEFP